MSKLDNLYGRLPVWAQHASVSAFGGYWRWLRFGPGYLDLLNGYLEREKYSSNDWQAWSQHQIAELLKLAVTQVPYYRNIWDERQKQAAWVGELQELPLLEKDPVRANPRALIREDLQPGRDYTFYTSGSTGSPIASIWTRSEVRASMAIREARSTRWAGTSFSRPRATFSGRMVEPDPLSRGPYYRFNLAERQVYLSPFHLRPDTARHYVSALEKHQVEWLTGYAVSYYLLGKMILDQKLSLKPLKAVITTSEKVTPEMRQVMEEAYSCRVYEEYSTVENVLFASECDFGRLHVSPDAGFVEILHPDRTPCPPGEVGEVVTTCLMRNYQIFIRYRLGDLAAWDSESCPCGRAMPVIKEVVGRIEDVVIGPDGRQLVRFHGVFINQPHVREGQIIQEAPDHIRVKVVPCNGFGAADVEDIIHRVQQRLGENVRVDVQPVQDIPRTKAGKFQAVISNVATEKLKH
jgi:phenylacetate-CoA ligase